MSLNTILATAPLTTSGYHIKANGTTLGNSLIWDNGTNVGIGNTNTSYTLDVTGTGRFTGQLYANAKLEVNDTNGIPIRFQDISAAITGQTAGYIGMSTSAFSGNNGDLVLYPRTSATSKILLMGGNVGIGNSSPTAKLEITNGRVLLNNGYSYQFYNTSSVAVDTLQMFTDGNVYLDAKDSTGGALIFRTSNSNTERMRITSTGNFNFNTAGSGAAYVQLNQPTGQDGGILWLRNNSNKFQQALDNSDNMVFYSYAISTNAYKINGNGSASLYGALTQNASDRRLKNNITNIPNALDKIKTLNGVTFTWENSIYKTERINDIGVIAQEVQSVLPEAVSLAPFDIDDNGNSKSGENYLTVYYEKLIPLLIEGIKELSKQNEELSNRLIKAGL